MRKLSLILTGVALYLPAPSFAEDVKNNLCQGAGNFVAGGNIEHPKCGTGLTSHLTGSITNLTNTLMFIAGAIAVLVIIIGGLRYVTSGGDAGRVKQAKDSILYAVVGLIVAIMAYALVRFVAKAIS